MKTEIDFNKPIPKDLQGPDPKVWKEIAIKSKKNNALVALGPFQNFSEIYTDKIYGGERVSSPYQQDPLENNIAILATTRDAKRLVRAQQLLPQGLYLAALDIYRPLQTQQALFDKYYQSLEKTLPGVDKDDLITETQKYVSIPSGIPTRPSPHYTGGAVDITIFKLPPEIDTEVQQIDKHLAHLRRWEWKNMFLLHPKDFGWEEFYRLEYRRMQIKSYSARFLDFGVPFDWGGQEAAINYYEFLAEKKELTEEEIEVRDNRRMLYNTMTAVGFQPYLHEWWHYNAPEIQMGAETSGRKFAISGGQEPSSELLSWQQTMIRWKSGIRTTWETQGQPQGKLGNFNPYSQIVRDSTLANGNPDFSSMPQAKSITPQ